MKNAVYILVVLLTAIPCRARIITVDDDGPADFNNIQAAIDDANNGDTVEVQPGTYTGPGNRDIDFKGKPITVRSTDPNNPNIVTSTVIDCNGTETDPHWGFHIHDNEGCLSVIAGLKIMNGYVGGADGGGIRCDNTTVIIRNCTMRDNQAPEDCNILGCRGGDGAAISCSDSNALITGCTIAGNVGISTVAFSNSTGTVTDCSISGNNAGAIYCYKSSVEVVACTISDNRARDGAGLKAYEGSSVMIDRCTLANNRAYDSGGAVVVGALDRFVRGSTVIISNSTLTANSSVGHRQGGAIVCWGNNTLVLIDSELTRNYTNNHGGAVYSSGGLTISGCKITGNKADKSGGGLDFQCPATITNSLIAGNTAGRRGGGVCCTSMYTTLAMTNCTIAHNRAKAGDGGILCGAECTTAANCILWANSPNQIGDFAGVAYSDVENGWPGEGNIDGDPCFANPGYWEPNGTPEDANDDFWVDGDYHLRSNVGRYDANAGIWVIDDVTSPCIDTGNPMTPIGHEPFPNGGVINMGAYGGTPEASKSYFGQPLCEIIIAGDINGDCIVDARDFSFIGRHWLADNTLWPPSRATDPNPPHRGTDVPITPILNWTAGSGATSHDVYFGVTAPSAYRGNQTGTTFEPGTLDYNRTYHWRIDERNADGITTGPVWSFSTPFRLDPAANPNPPDGSTGIRTDPLLSWAPGIGADSHDVYFGVTNSPAFQTNQTATTFYPGPLSEETTYYWRIDERNRSGATTIGGVWTFTTRETGGVR